jgi:hypothetical protein
MDERLKLGAAYLSTCLVSMLVGYLGEKGFMYSNQVVSEAVQGIANAEIERAIPGVVGGIEGVGTGAAGILSGNLTGEVIGRKLIQNRKYIEGLQGILVVAPLSTGLGFAIGLAEDLAKYVL